MRLPNEESAVRMLNEAAELNPGAWKQHSIYTAEAARRIAEKHKDLNSKAAYILGLLHDIGRRYGITNLKHSIDGYNFLNEQGYSDAARICITHSFPYKDMNVFFGAKDCSDEEIAFIEGYLNKVQYDEYDKLIQLCDALALPDGFCLLEKRMVDDALRYGTSEQTVLKWRATFDIKEQIEKAINMSIYKVLPGVIENTFELND